LKTFKLFDYQAQQQISRTKPIAWKVHIALSMPSLLQRGCPRDPGLAWFCSLALAREILHKGGFRNSPNAPRKWIRNCCSLFAGSLPPSRVELAIYGTDAAVSPATFIIALTIVLVVGIALRNAN